jgi:hypothetical protein
VKAKPLQEAKPTGEPGWNWRKAIIFPAVIWCFYCLKMLEGGVDTRLNGDLAWGYQMLVMVLILGFTGLATVQDIAAIWATKSGLPYSPQSSPAEPTPGTEASPKEE